MGNIKENLITKYLEIYYDELEPMEFYRYLFPVGSFQDKGEYKRGIYNGMIAIIDNKGRACKKIVTDDLEEIRKCMVSEDFCVMRPISYVGKNATEKNSRELYSMTIDLDGIICKDNIPQGLINLFVQIEQAGRIPMPTVIVSSGTGIHLYYIFDKPIRLLPNVMKKIKEMRIQLIKLIWHETITVYSEQIQYECLNQGFRMVGTKTKKGTIARAFWTGEKITIDHINEFVEEEYRINKDELLLLNRQDKENYFKSLNELENKSDKSNDKSETYYDEDFGVSVTYDKKYNRTGETWNVNYKLYEWWLKRIKTEAKVGHRYYCLLTLSAIAKKCNIPYDKLEKDSYDMIDYLDSLTDDRECNPFTREDIKAALKGYNKQNEKMTKKTISLLSGIEIKSNKRNYRTREQHITIMNFIRDEIVYKNKSWRNEDGRPKKDNIIKEWKEKNPNGTKKDCVKELKGIVGKTTIYKWWDTI